MNKASELRSFARAAELAAGLMPRLARAKVMSGGEAELLARQLRGGAEVALDVAVNMEAAVHIQQRASEGDVGT